MSSAKRREKPQKSSTEPEEKVRILCLHGYRQNGEVFKSKIGSFRKHLQKYAEFVFLTAPHSVHMVNGETSKQTADTIQRIDDNDASAEPIESNNDSRSWWFNSEDGTFKGTNKNAVAYGFDDSIRALEQAWQMLGPFQGILGFSQGAALVGLVCNLRMRGMTTINPQFAILAAGFRSGSLAHANYYEDLITIPSLHIMGANDEIIPCDMSKSLAMCFDEPTIVEHVGGHYFAATALQRNNYVEFIRKRLVEYLEQKELEREDAVVIDPLDGIPSTSAEMSDDSD